jgi:hypothetical protein
MERLAERVALIVVVVPVLLVIEPWHLQWWWVDILLGAIIFAFTLRDPPEPSLRPALIGALISLGLFVLGFLVARTYGLSLGQLASDYSFHKAIRRVPDYATVALTYSFLLSVRALACAHTKEDAGEPGGS